ncbi:hypothetical protein LCGC14_2717230, partial [marine sediment metagenome]
LGAYDQDIIDDIHTGEYISLYFDTNIKNIESLELLNITLYGNSGLMSDDTQIIYREELIMRDNSIKINLPTDTNTLKKIRLTPVFRSDNEYNENNTIGIAQFQTIEWDPALVSTNADDHEYMTITLDHDLKTELNGLELAYVFNDQLQYLTFPYNITYTLEEYSRTISSYILYIPSSYIDPNTNETVSFQEGDIVALRYNSPVKSGIPIGIGSLYLENKGYNYDSHKDIPKAEILLVNASSDVAYSEFTSGYYYQTPIQPTPFNTEYNNRYSSVKIDLNFTSLYESTSSTVLNFTHIVFSVPNPTYELTINEIFILEESYEPTTQDGSFDGRVWQYTEFESFDADESPEDDEYQLILANTSLFYPDFEWLEYINIYDENGNYYTVGITGNDHQLHFNPSNDTLTWNPNFNQFPEYFGMEFQEPLLIAPNKT